MNLSSECRNLYTYSVINTQETKRDRRRLKEREAFILITVTNYTKVTCLQRIYDHSVQIAEFLVHPLIRPGLEIHIVFFYLNLVVRILTLNLTLNKTQCANCF